MNHIRIKVFPRAKKSSVEKRGENVYYIYTKSAREENRANHEALQLLAKERGVEEKKLRIVSGHHRRSKIIEIL